MPQTNCASGCNHMKSNVSSKWRLYGLKNPIPQMVVWRTWRLQTTITNHNWGFGSCVTSPLVQRVSIVGFSFYLFLVLRFDNFPTHISIVLLLHMHAGIWFYFLCAPVLRFLWARPPVLSKRAVPVTQHQANYEIIQPTFRLRNNNHPQTSDRHF